MSSQQAQPFTAQGLFPHGIAGVIFDCDGVMIDSRTANNIYYNRVLAWFGLPAHDSGAGILQLHGHIRAGAAAYCAAAPAPRD